MDVTLDPTAEPTAAPAAETVLEAAVEPALEPALEATEIVVRGGLGDLLPATSLRVSRAAVVVALGPPGHAHAALALALAGRLHLDRGSVRIGPDPSRRRLQREVALVDVPGVSEPDENLLLQTVVAEELALAGARTGSRAVRRWAAEHGVEPWLRTPMEAVPARERTRVLANLAAQREAVRFLVLTLPDRFGEPPSSWLPHARDLARRGFGVLVTAGPVTITPPDVHTVSLGSEES